MLNHAALQRWPGANFTAGRGHAREGGRAPEIGNFGNLHRGNIVDELAGA
jgi:hypothetical protein